MAWIREIGESEAAGRLAEIYAEIAQRRGKVSNIMRVQSLFPEAMQTHLSLYITLLFGAGSGLTRAERELLAVTVSATNRCAYCVRHHAEALRAYWKDDHRLERVLAGDWTELSERERALCTYARRLTSTPDQAKPDWVEELRRAGLTDEEILHANLIISYFNFVNRIALGLGVEFTEEEARGYRV